MDVGRISRGWKRGRGSRRDGRWKGWWAVVELATDVADCRRIRDVGAQDIEDSCLNSLTCRGSALYMVGTSAWI